VGFPGFLRRSFIEFPILFDSSVFQTVNFPPMRGKKWIFAFILTLVVSGFLLFYGVKAGENNEINMNASLICFSCIGLE